MDSKTVRELENACQRALAEVLRENYGENVSDQITHLMAKAAVTVLEAVDMPAEK